MIAQQLSYLLVNFRRQLKIKNSIFFLLALLATITVFGQNYSTIEFIENKGQWDKKVQFTGAVPGGAFFIHQAGFTVLQHNPQDWQQVQESIHGHEEGKENARKKAITLRSHAYNVQFIGGAANPKIVADKPLATQTNYFIGNDPSKWASNCKTYQGITVQEIYPNIDLRYYSSNGQMKYDLIVKPGADPSKIALKYDGADKLDIKNNQLVVKTSIGEVKELSPYTYQYNGKGKKEITTRYKIDGNIVRFEVGKYDKTTILTIDPTFIFASYSGSTASNWGFTATYGPDGSLFGGGIVFGTGFPVSTGAFQETFGGGIQDGYRGGGYDIGIIKLSPDGSNRLFATYIGGKVGNEQPHSLIVDQQGNLILAGRSNSTDYPTTGNGLIGTGGGFDIVVTKFNATGSALSGSKRIGGNKDDGVNIKPQHDGPQTLQQNYGDAGRSEVIIDGGGNIYVASCTQSDNFPIVGGFQTTYGGGAQDGALLKLPADVSGLTFSSFHGGTGDDAAYVLSLHPSNANIYVAGGTTSPSLQGAGGASLYGSNQGGVDGYVSIISNNGSSVIKTTFLGTGNTDQVYGVQFDRAGYPYVMGQTRGDWPVINAAWSQPGAKQFISKLEPDLSAFVYSTRFGTNNPVPNISPVAFLVDRCENVYVSGWGGTVANGYQSAGTLGLPMMNSLGLASPDGKDFYFFVLQRNATAQLYGDIFGQNGGLPDHVDGGTSRFDANGVIYQAICANCNGGPGMFAQGSWSPTNGAAPSGCNLGMVKIALDLAGTAAGIQPSINGVPNDSSGCVPLTVDFRDTLLNAVSYEWDFTGDGVTDGITTKPDTSYTYNSIGSYRVRLIAVDSSTCNIRDTSFVTIHVGDLQALPAFTANKLLPCEALKYEFVNTSVQPPGRPFTDTSFVWDFGDGSAPVRSGLAKQTHAYPSPGSYKIRLSLVDTGYCNAPDFFEMTINVAAFVKAKFTAPPGGCTPHTAVFVNESDGGQQFFWDFGDGNAVSTDPNPQHTYSVNTTTTFTVRLRVIDSATCNIVDSISSTIIVFGTPTANFTVAPQPPPVNTEITFTNLSSPDAVRFKWLFGDGDSLLTTSRNPITHEYNATNTFNAQLIAYNATNCPDTFSLAVRAIVEPALDVPNAFTPNSNDENSVVFARGYAIGKLKFIIWNRWGQKVFETEDRKIGWNGKYKGVLQPMDVYAYTIEVEFTDGTKASKKGDITLIR